VLDAGDRAACAVPGKLACLSCLTQLDSLQIIGVASDSAAGHLTAALAPLTRLARLTLTFDDDYESTEGHDPVFPWQDAVSGLTNLQELCVMSEVDWGCVDMFKGALPAGLSQLTALRRLTVLGMDELDAHDESDQLQLAALPALETVALRLRSVSGIYPGFPDQQQVIMSRLVSLSLALRRNRSCLGFGSEPYEGTYLPTIVAPALTELILDDIMLAPDSEQLSWLPGLPALQRLVLQDLKTGASQLPQGVAACSSLTELVLRRVHVSMQPGVDGLVDVAQCGLRSLPAAGPYVSKLVHLNLANNAFRSVPPCLAAATALETLNLCMQQLQPYHEIRVHVPVLGLHVLDNLARFRWINLEGFKKSAAGIRRLKKTHRNVTVV